MSSNNDVPREYVCLGCGEAFTGEQARLDCEARHVEEELLAVGEYPEWLAGFGGPSQMEEGEWL